MWGEYGVVAVVVDRLLCAQVLKQIRFPSMSHSAIHRFFAVVLFTRKSHWRRASNAFRCQLKVRCRGGGGRNRLFKGIYWGSSQYLNISTLSMTSRSTFCFQTSWFSAYLHELISWNFRKTKVIRDEEIFNSDLWKSRAWSISCEKNQCNCNRVHQCIAWAMMDF